ncbi:cytochrome P450 [Podospora australis]|uniref:Cytochrome P450 n=1 Tax=Podospora australis TaxID=1536484 RepID=A0AAN6WHT9_9PEZI|nr:cytochrome P450 [Podospora australis]
MRLLYPKTTNLLRAVPPKGATISGHFVSSGTTVAVNHWAVYRSSKHWTRSTEFLPERWLGDEEFKNDKRSALNPFQTGPRACLGRNLAMLELRLILASLLWWFDLEPSADSPKRGEWESSMRSQAVWERPHLMVRVKKRV